MVDKLIPKYKLRPHEYQNLVIDTSRHLLDITSYNDYVREYEVKYGGTFGEVTTEAGGLSVGDAIILITDFTKRELLAWITGIIAADGSQIRFRFTEVSSRYSYKHDGVYYAINRGSPLHVGIAMADIRHAAVKGWLHKHGYMDECYCGDYACNNSCRAKLREIKFNELLNHKKVR